MPEEEKKTRKKAAPKKKTATKKGSTVSTKKKKEEEEIIPAVIEKKEAPAPKKETPPVPPRPTTPTPRSRQQNGGSGRMFGFFLLVLIIVGAIIGVQALVNANKEDKLENKLSTLEQMTSDLISKTGELAKDKEELEKKVEKTEKQLDRTQLQLLEDDLRDERAKGDSVSNAQYCDVDVPEGETISIQVHPRYTGLSVLGELFTANNCLDPEILANLSGVTEEGEYVGALTVELFSNEELTPELYTLLTEQLSFFCDQDVESPTECRIWTFAGSAPLDEMLLLEDYTSSFRLDRKAL